MIVANKIFSLRSLVFHIVSIKGVRMKWYLLHMKAYYRRVQMLLRLTLSRYWETNWCYLRSKSQFDTMHRWIVCKLRECIDLKIWNHHLLSRVVVDPFTLIWIQLVEMYLRRERSMCSAELISTNISCQYKYRWVVIFEDDICESL